MTAAKFVKQQQPKKVEGFTDDERQAIHLVLDEILGGFPYDFFLNICKLDDAKSDEMLYALISAAKKI